MAERFMVEILTPERVFFTGAVCGVSVETLNGRMSVLACHAPMVASLSVGRLVIDTGEEEKTAFHSKGFMDVTSAYVVILCQTCEWPGEIDEARARRALQRARERLALPAGQARPDNVVRCKLAMSRALGRLKVKGACGGKGAN